MDVGTHEMIDPIGGSDTIGPNREAAGKAEIAPW